MSAPLDRSASWPYDAAGEPGAFAYAREDHPNAVAVEETIGALEGGRSLLFPAGMGAVTGVVLTMLPPGGTIAVAEGAYLRPHAAVSTTCAPGASTRSSTTRPGRLLRTPT